MCGGPVYTVDETFADPQVKARQMVTRIQDPRYGDGHQAGIAIKLSQTPGRIRRVAPTVGEHTDEVLRELGYSEADRLRLRQEQVVA